MLVTVFSSVLVLPSFLLRLFFLPFQHHMKIIFKSNKTGPLCWTSYKSGSPGLGLEKLYLKKGPRWALEVSDPSLLKERPE